MIRFQGFQGLTFMFSRARKKTSQSKGFQGTFQVKEKIQGIFKGFKVSKDQWPPYNWFARSEMIKKLFTGLYADENILYFNEDSGDAEFNYNEMGIVNIDLTILILIIILMKMILTILFLSDFWLGILNLKKRKNLKKNK